MPLTQPERTQLVWLGAGILGILGMLRYKPQWAGYTVMILALYYAGRTVTR